MAVVQALYVDDESLLRSQYVENLRIALEDACGIKLEVDEVDRVEEAKRRLPRDQRRYQIVITDLLFESIGVGTDNGKTPRGLEVIGQASKTSGVVIVAVSIGDTKRFPDLETQALDAGAHIFRYKQAIQADPQGWDDLADAICAEITEPPSASESGGASPRDTLDRQIGSHEVTDRSTLFVVHGRDSQLAGDFYQFLRALDLRPYEWEYVVNETIKRRRTGGNPSVLEVIDVGFTLAFGAVVLLTPDDEVRLKAEHLLPNDPAYERVLTGQARPNVLFESGIAVGRMPERTLMVSVGSVRPFSDIAGRHLVHLEDAAERRKAVAGRLTSLGCAVNVEGDDWLHVGNFSTGTSAPGGRKK